MGRLDKAREAAQRLGEAAQKLGEQARDKTHEVALQRKFDGLSKTGVIASRHESRRDFERAVEQVSVEAVIGHLLYLSDRLRPELALAVFTRAILEAAPLPLFGDGSVLRDFTHVSDICRGIA